MKITLRIFCCLLVVFLIVSCGSEEERAIKTYEKLADKMVVEMEKITDKYFGEVRKNITNPEVTEELRKKYDAEMEELKKHEQEMDEIATKIPPEKKQEIDFRWAQKLTKVIERAKEKHGM